MKKKIKVLHFIVGLGNGGAERQLIELLKYNRKKYKKSIKVTFKNKRKNVNIVNTIKKIKTIKSNENSKNILKNYFVKLI